MMADLLIGFGGYAFSGKDTAADILTDKYGWRKLYMSQVLEQALLALNPITEASSIPGIGPDGTPYVSVLRYQDTHRMLGYDRSKELPEVRALLQRLGTEVGRNLLGENVWVNAVFAQADIVLAEGTNVSVCGIRYRNELGAVHKRGGRSVWVDRGLDPVNDHSSDNALSAEDFDYVLDNKGTLTDLADSVADLVIYIERYRT